MYHLDREEPVGMVDTESATADFECILYNQLIPAFCDDPKRRCDISTFVAASNRVVEQDARDFVDAWNAGLIEHQGHGRYRAAQSAASEQFFWTGRNVPGVRSFTLWMEPVITVAALGRLHHRHQWPKHLIGTQSADWAFDVVTVLPDRQGESIAGEVKKTRREVDQLIALMEHFGREPDFIEPTNSGKERNAYKKMAALRLRRAPIFWAVGPDGYNKVFRVAYNDDGSVNLAPSDDSALNFPASGNMKL